MNYLLINAFELVNIFSYWFYYLRKNKLDRFFYIDIHVHYLLHKKTFFNPSNKVYVLIYNKNICALNISDVNFINDSYDIVDMFINVVKRKYLLFYDIGFYTIYKLDFNKTY